MKFPQVETKTTYVKFRGGVDQVSPVLAVSPGDALDAHNYEPGVYGGFKRIDGIERFDGRSAPSDATYYYVTMTLTGALAVGDAITGVTSGATATVCVVGTGEFAYTKVTGSFVSGEVINVGGSPQATLTSTPAEQGYTDGYDNAVATNAAADVYRALIQKVPGSGSILGVFMYKGTVYALRNNVGATAAVLYKSTASGWSSVSLGREVAFTSGGTTEIVEGNTITGATSGATAVITRVVRSSGSWAAGDAAGYLYFASQTGTFQSENLNVGASLNVATIGGNSSAITLQPSGRYECVIHNFYGSTDTLRVYGCDGVNYAFEFDGTVFVRIRTGMTTDTPAYIAAYKKQLFLSFRGSLQNSGIGTPYVWSAVTGASEIGTGEDITGLLPQPGSTLAIFTRNSTLQLNGSSVSDFVLGIISSESGAIGRTCQNLGNAFCLDDRGITNISRTQNYGNFDFATVSRKAQTSINAMRALVVGSTVYRSRNQYRLYGSDGSGIILALDGQKVIGITTFSYPVAMNCFWSGEDSTGKDVVFMGGTDGYVYQADKGSSFDGEEIEAYVRMPFNNIETPRWRKRYRKVVMEMSAIDYAAIQFSPMFSYGDADVPESRSQEAAIQGGGGFWDTVDWDSFIFDADVSTAPEFSVEGTGVNMSLVFYSSSDIDLGHTLSGAIVHYTIRRLQR